MFFICVSGASASEDNSSAKERQYTFKELFALIEDNSSFVVVFDKADINLSEKIKFDGTKRPIRKIIEEVFSKRSDIGYTIYNNQIIIRKKTVKETVPKKAPQQQTKKKLPGIVKGKDGEPLIGVSVAEKGTSNGTITNVEGRFSLNVSLPTTLVFSYVGYMPKEIEVKGQATLEVSLTPNVKELEEVVVVGYGNKSSKSLTGAVNVVSASVIEKQTSTNIVSALQGTIPGVAVSRTGGAPGEEGYKFNIRGVSSLNASDPLVIIDGIPGSLEQLDLINPSDIKDITILKDAAAAIYGARAAGGVMLVTTKSGTGASKVTVNSRFMLKTPALIPDRVSTLQHFEMANEAYANDGIANSPFAKYSGIPLDGRWVEGPFPDTPNIKMIDNDWTDILWGSSWSQQHGITYSGTTDKTKYSLSVGYLKDEGMLNYGTNFSERYNARLNYEFKIGERLTLTPIVGLSYKKTERPNNLGSVYRTSLMPYSSVPKYADNGLPFDFGGFASPIGVATQGGKRMEHLMTVNTNIKADYKIIDDLILTAQAGLNYTNKYANSYSRRWLAATNAAGDRTKQHPNAKGENRVDKSDNRSVYSNYTTYLNYKKTIAGDHKFNLMAGASKETFRYDGFSAWRLNTLSDELHHLKLGDPEKQFNNASTTEWALASVFGRFDYNYKDRYYLEVQYRNDGSSRFVKDTRWKGFSSYLLGWTITNESFMSGQKLFDFLKLKASYGNSGNQAGIGLYDYVTMINQAGSYPFGIGGSQTPAFTSGAMVSLNRTWEKVNIQNLGIEFKMLNNRLSGSFDVYKKVNENMLIAVTYPTILGAAAPKTNSGELEVKGFEAVLKWQDKIGTFSYFVEATLSDSKNKLIDLAGADTYGAGTVKAREGYPINTVFGYESDGFIRTEEELKEYKKMEGVQQDIRIGDMKYKDLDGDGKLNPYGDNGGDLKVLGDWNDRYLYGLRLGGKFRNFDFSCFFQGVGKKLTALNGSLRPMAAWWDQPYALMYHNTWHETRTDADYPKMSTRGSVNGWNYRVSDNTVESYGYVRLKNLQVGYTLNSGRFIKATGLKSLRVYVTGNDLWESSPLPENFDPEKGLYHGFYPFARYMGGGIDITF
ncbi:SusC/RagA family TonB-linked outer membrane protein [Fulvitalea axinellae]|uniref:SusC/RagA family TonB-linked outer membrane protein n=1 Tax=Fulvitalea axinellae TaxID=1182444 RepID=UPI0030CA4AC5